VSQCLRATIASVLIQLTCMPAPAVSGPQCPVRGSLHPQQAPAVHRDPVDAIPPAFHSSASVSHPKSAACAAEASRELCTGHWSLCCG